MDKKVFFCEKSFLVHFIVTNFVREKKFFWTKNGAKLLGEQICLENNLVKHDILKKVLRGESFVVKPFFLEKS